MNKRKDINILAQAFYGNRTGTEIFVENMDAFILGSLDGVIRKSEKIDRTIIRIPERENVVLIYNKYQEEESLQWREELLEKENYVLKPLATVGDLVIYSRVIACRMDDEGKFASLEPEDYGMLMKYFAA